MVNDIKLKTRESKKGVQNGLEEELKRLKRILNISYNLEVRWIPDNSSKLSGKVLGGTIYIYEDDEDEALKALRHEVLDYLISQAIEPYKEVTNMLIRHINEDAYKLKEKIVGALTRLLIERTND